MGIVDQLRGLLQGRLVGGSVIEYVGPTRSEVLGMGADELFRTQPHLRTVITFLARNVSQLPLQTFQRVGDNDRKRLRDHPVARVLAKPNPYTTGVELIYQLEADFKLYDFAVWHVHEDPTLGWQIYPISPAWVQERSGSSLWDTGDLVVVDPQSGVRVEIPREELIVFHGWNPGSYSKGASPVESLREILAEQIEAWGYRRQIWERGGRVGTYLTRPAGVVWSDSARQKFSEEWRAKWTGRDGTSAGGTPILEDGMTLGSVRFNAREEQWSETAKLSLSTVAAVYHTSPTMVGVLDNANYSNVREFSRMLYTDTLGPDLAMIEARLNQFLVPKLTDDIDVYVEFNIQAKLAGSFEDQAQLLSTSVGRPWMTANEARARFNMPAIGDDGDGLVTPLNVLVGGQASPRDTGTQNLNEAPGPRVKSDPIRIKAKATASQVDDAASVFSRFFSRQRKSVLSAMGAGDDWWDGERWDRELSDDLEALSLSSSEETALAALEKAGIDPSVYSVDRTRAFLRAVAESRAGAVNATTLRQLKKALAAGDDSDAMRSTPEGVFDLAEESRADAAGVTFATTVASFAVTEAGRQSGVSGVQKTWVVTSANPRPSHAAMDGETVGIDDVYSNGARWPGDSVLGVDEIAGCSCTSEILIP